MSDLEHVVSSQCKLGEGPVWHPLEQVIYWLDIYQHNLHRYDPHTGAHQVTPLGMLASAMGIRAKGGFVMATRRGFAFWSPETGEFTFLGDPDADEDESETVRFNDGKTDPQGRFWAGKMSARPENSLFRLDVDLSIHRMERDITISNGLGWSPDQRTFYYTDSDARTIFAYDFDPANGDLSNRRVFSSIPHLPGEGFPDGLAVDAEGCIWSARWGGWKIVRYDPLGRVEREIPMPVEFPTSCAFGGADLDELYITSAWVEVKPENRAKQPLAGDLFRLKVGVKGLSEPFFGG